MSFDEQPDGDIHGECAAEIRKLRDLLRTERRMRGGMAFKCRDSACCNFGHWVCECNCDCYRHQRVEHDYAVDRALGIR